MKKVPCEVYSRVVGYFRPVQNWNPGKVAEFGDRVAYNVNVSLVHGELLAEEVIIPHDWPAYEPVSV